MENTIFDVRRKMYRKNGKEEIQSLGEYYNEHTWINESGKMGCSYNLAVNQTFFSFFFFLRYNTFSRLMHISLCLALGLLDPWSA